MMTELRSTSGNKYQPSCCTCGSMAARSAVAPAGGCIVLVSAMAADANPHVKAPASHRKSSKSEFSKKSLVTPTPMRAERKCPAMEFRGWARGDSIVLNSRIAAAPCVKSVRIFVNCRGRDHTKLAISNGTPWLRIVGIMKTTSMTTIPTKAPRKAHPATRTLPISGLGLSRYPKKRDIGFGSLEIRFLGRWGLRWRSMSKCQSFASRRCILCCQCGIRPCSAWNSRL